MTTVYSLKDQLWIDAPQTTKWRVRYRGQRESYKTNLEMQQFLYDIRRLYEGTGQASFLIENNYLAVEYGSTFNDIYWSNTYPNVTYNAGIYDQGLYDSEIFVASPLVNNTTINTAPKGISVDLSYANILNQMSSTELSSVVSNMTSVGVKWVQFDYQFTSGTDGTIRNGANDTVLQQVIASGIDIVVSFTCSAGLWNTTWLTLAVDHLSSLGIHVYEVLSEVNLFNSGPDGGDPSSYVATLQSAYEIIHTNDAQAVVLHAGLAPYGASTGAVQTGNNWNPVDFLQQMYLDGAQGYFDASNFHTFTSPLLPATESDINTFLQLPNAYSLMQQYGDGNKKIWITEFGSQAGSDDTSQLLQALTCTQGYALADSWSWAGPCLWYTWEDTTDDFGLFDTSGNPKMAERTYAQIHTPIDASSHVNHWDSNTAGLSTLQVSPTRMGDILVLAVGTYTSSTVKVESVSGGGCPFWTHIITENGGLGYGNVDIWYGTVFNPGTAPITVTYDSDVSFINCELVCDEFVSTYGNLAQWSSTASTSGTIEGSAIDYPSLTPVPHQSEIYYGYALIMSSYIQDVLANDPVAYWPMDDTVGSTTVADISGNGYNGTIVGAVTFQRSPSTVDYDGGHADSYESFTIDGGDAASVATQTLDGSSGEDAQFVGGYIVAPAIAQPSTSIFTVEAWFRTGTLPSSWQTILSGTYGLLWMNSSGAVQFQDGSGNYIESDTVSYADDSWHFVAVVVDGASMANASLYIDGVKIASTESGSWVIPTASNVWIGSNGAGNDLFSGDISNVALFPSALSGATIESQYQANSTAPLPVDTINNFTFMPTLENDSVVYNTNYYITTTVPAQALDAQSYVTYAGCLVQPTSAWMSFNVTGTADIDIRIAKLQERVRSLEAALV